MKEPLTTRLQTFKQEFEIGRKMPADAEMKQSGLQKNLLRISWAIQVLEEELARTEQPSAPQVEE